jgi:hypothetical protein
MLWKPHVAIEIIFSEPERETGLHMKHNRPLFGRIECLGVIRRSTLAGSQLALGSFLRVESILIPFSKILPPHQLLGDKINCL